MTSKYPLPTSEAVPHFSPCFIVLLGVLLAAAIGMGLLLVWAVTI